MQNCASRGILCVLMAFVASSCPVWAEKAPAMKIAMIKADDVSSLTPKWQRFIAISKERNVKVACGVICNSLVNPKKEYVDWMLSEEKSGFVEFWNHGWDHKKWETNGVEVQEFRGSGYEHQKENFGKAQDIMEKVLGRPTVALGTPYNGFDDDTARVLREDRKSIQLLFRNNNPQIDGIIAARFDWPKPGVPPKSINGQIPFAAMQYHPNKFSDAEFEQYAALLDALLKDGWTFMLPREYIAWLNKKK
ncbi:MAG: polysaccharide deacetylase family protein [Kiritimatiellales bacterium]|nr:polysaccharide deacetylase family protein [Kiritimatiellales bacterium]